MGVADRRRRRHRLLVQFGVTSPDGCIDSQVSTHADGAGEGL
jgi:hypothetical protein